MPYRVNNDGPKPVPLTKTALAKHNAEQARASDTNDYTFTEGLIRSEAARLYERVMFDVANDRLDLAEAQVDDLQAMLIVHYKHVDLVALTTRLYGHHQPGAVRPLERWVNVSRDNEPFPLLAEQAMQAVGVTLGSLDMLEKRAKAAKAVAAAARSGS